MIAPVVPAARIGRRGRQHLAVECPFCGETHYHGAGGSFGAGNGPRRSHCQHDARRGDYVLREFSTGHLAIDVRTANEEAAQ